MSAPIDLRSRTSHPLARGGDERGSSSVQFVIVFTVLVIGFVMLFQFGIRFHAGRVAESAAREAAVAEAHFEGTKNDAVSTAQDHLATGGPVIIGSQVTASRTSTVATVTVTVEPFALMPILNEPITVTAKVPVERYVP